MLTLVIIKLLDVLSLQLNSISTHKKDIKGVLNLSKTSCHARKINEASNFFISFSRDIFWN